MTTCPAVVVDDRVLVVGLCAAVVAPTVACGPARRINPQGRPGALCFHDAGAGSLNASAKRGPLPVVVTSTKVAARAGWRPLRAVGLTARRLTTEVDGGSLNLLIGLKQRRVP